MSKNIKDEQDVNLDDNKLPITPNKDSKDVKDVKNEKDTKDDPSSEDVSVVEKVGDKEIIINVKMPKIDANKTYSADEIKKIVSDVASSVSQTTKNQLYPDIQSLKEKNTELNTKISELENKSGKTKDEEKLVTDLKAEVAVLRNTISDLQLNMTTDKLTSLKNKLIADAKGRIVADMVTGNSEEELNSNYQKAVEKYKEIEKSIRQSLNLPIEEDDTKEVDSKDEKPVEIKRINDMEERINYKKERTALKNQLYKRAGLDLKV